VLPLRYIKHSEGRIEELDAVGFEWQQPAPPASREPAVKRVEAPARDAVGPCSRPSFSPSSGPTTSARRAVVARDGASAAVPAGTGYFSGSGLGAPLTAATREAALGAGATLGAPLGDTLLEAADDDGLPRAELTVRVAEADPASVGFEQLLGCFRQYVAVTGRVEVPVTFTVPDAEPWPLVCRSLPLGMCLNHIHTRGAYLSPRVVLPGIAKRRSLLDVPLTKAQARELDALAAAEIKSREDRLLAAGYAVPLPQRRGAGYTTSARFGQLVSSPLERCSLLIGDDTTAACDPILSSKQAISISQSLSVRPCYQLQRTHLNLSFLTFARSRCADHGLGQVQGEARDAGCSAALRHPGELTGVAGGGLGPAPRRACQHRPEPGNLRQELPREKRPAHRDGVSVPQRLTDIFCNLFFHLHRPTTLPLCWSVRV